MEKYNYPNNKFSNRTIRPLASWCYFLAGLETAHLIKHFDVKPGFYILSIIIYLIIGFALGRFKSRIAAIAFLLLFSIMTYLKFSHQNFSDLNQAKYLFEVISILLGALAVYGTIKYHKISGIKNDRDNS